MRSISITPCHSKRQSAVGRTHSFDVRVPPTTVLKSLIVALQRKQNVRHYGRSVSKRVERLTRH